MSADAVILADGDFPRAGGEARLILERARRVADWLETEPLADTNRLAVVGLSRLGKTALWAGATDERFAMVCPTCSGLFGARMAPRQPRLLWQHALGDDECPLRLCFGCPLVCKIVSLLANCLISLR